MPATFVAATLLTASATASAQACNPAAYDTVCEGSTLICTDFAMNVAEVNCPGLLVGFPAEEQVFSCGPFFDCTGEECDAVQVDCVGREGARCFNKNRLENRLLFCESGLGCVTEHRGADRAEICRPTSDCAAAEVHRGCVNGVATRCDELGENQTIVGAGGLLCESFDARCLMMAGAPRCVSLEGGICDSPLLYPETLYRCAEELECTGYAVNVHGTCTRREVPDEQEPTPIVDGGSAFSDDESGCTHIAGKGGSGSKLPSALALMFLLLHSRRRERRI